MKIAIALEIDLLTLAHFGQAEWFAIYSDETGVLQYQENRSNNPPCGSADSAPLMTVAARLISDCAAVVAARFGPCALRETAAAGVYPFEMQGILDKRLAAGLTRLRDHLMRGKPRNRGRITS